MQDKKEVYSCNKCKDVNKKPCITNDIGRFECPQPEWKPTKYQITEAPELVYYLDMPEMIIKSLGWLLDYDNKTVTFDPTRDTVYWGDGTSSSIKINGIPREWIKQKQPEPTREELQERLNRIISFSIELSDSQITQQVSQTFRDIATGEKP